MKGNRMTARKQAKALVRSTNRLGVRSKKAPPAVIRLGLPSHPSVCDGCAQVYAGKKWQRVELLERLDLARAHYTLCPACRQVEEGQHFGTLELSGPELVRNKTEILRRIRNVEARAGHTQPQRRIVSIERRGEQLRVLTTSQKLAHRIARELTKAFRGNAEYRWTDDGHLLATWRSPNL